MSDNGTPLATRVSNSVHAAGGGAEQMGAAQSDSIRTHITVEHQIHNGTCETFNKYTTDIIRLKETVANTLLKAKMVQ